MFSALKWMEVCIFSKHLLNCLFRSIAIRYLDVQLKCVIWHCTCKRIIFNMYSIQWKTILQQVSIDLIQHIPECIPILILLLCLCLTSGDVLDLVEAAFCQKYWLNRIHSQISICVQYSNIRWSNQRAMICVKSL